MLKMSRKPSKKLAKVVLATLMFTGGAQLAISPSVVEAAFVSAPTISGSIVKDGVSKPMVNYTSSNYGYGNRAFEGSESAFAQTTASGYNATITAATSWAVFGGVGLIEGTISGNTVTIEGDDTSINTVYGGSVFGSAGDSDEEIGTVKNNTVTVNGGTIKSVLGSNFGGYVSVLGTSTDNTVIINGGKVTNQIVGGYAMGGDASNNTVTIKGDANLSEKINIYGGITTPFTETKFATIDGVITAVPVTTIGAASNNTINILKTIMVAGLYGGIGDETKSTGNTLNVAAKGVVANDVAAFQNMNFYLPSDIANGDTMLTIKGNEDVSPTPANLKGVAFGVAALSGVNLQKGNTVNLVVGNNGLTTDDTLKTTDSATLAKASFLSANSLTTDDAYELSISKKDANTIIATVDNVTEKKAPEEAVDDIKKSPVETRAGVVTLLNAGTDMLVSQGMANAAEAAAAERSGGNAAAAPRAGGFAPFAAVGLGNLRAESGSHVNTKSIGLNLGFAREIENKSGKLLVGPVVEYGHGSYDSYQDNGITADGKSSYWGIGVIAKQTNNNGFYYEGSIRAGRTKSDYGSDNVKPGTHVSYDSSATYWALHLGAGKLVDIGHSNTLDYYGKYFYSHTGSDSAFLNGANETANFDAVNSHRIRLGARFIHAINEKNNIYGGLAWQYEFNGDARATYSVSGEAPSPSVKGSSGMIELGWQVKPGKSPMTIDLGVTGWVGKQRGITANVQANWTF